MNVMINLIIIAILSLTGCGPVAVIGTTSGVLAVHDRRTLGTLIDDATLELKVGQALAKDRSLYRKSHINVISYNNVVLLTGQTPNAPFKTRAENIVKEQPKVRYVYNEVVVGPTTTDKERAQDTWITTKIKAEILAYKHLDPTRIRVHTEDSIVYLMGLVTHVEAKASTAIAREIKGVQRVVKIFEYID